MKIVVLKSTKKAMGAEPILQCGGVILRHGETLAVRADLAQALTRAHPWLVASGGAEDAVALRSGVYEVRAPARQGAAAAPKAEDFEPAAEPAPELHPGDRSMAGSGKGKKKHK